MSAHLPFIRSKTDIKLFWEYFSDSEIVRVGYRLAKTEEFSRPECSSKLWIDPEFDGFEHAPGQRDSVWLELMRKLPNYSVISSVEGRVNLSKGEAEEFVFALFEELWKLKPSYLTVPQFANVLGRKTSRANKWLAKAAARWRENNRRRIDFILPIVVTRKSQTSGKTARNSIVKASRTLYELSDAAGIWVVDMDLDDQKGTGSFQNERFPGLIAFSQELNELISPKLSVCGPYWGLNLVIWARGLATHCGVALGGSYKYSFAGIDGRFMNPPKKRIALRSLRRWAIAKTHLIEWIKEAQKRLKDDPAHLAEFKELEKTVPILIARKGLAKKQIAEFYKDWFKSIEDTASGGRSVALFQDLSGAYVLGRKLKDLASEEQSARRPERVAEQLMFNCL